MFIGKSITRCYPNHVQLLYDRNISLCVCVRVYNPFLAPLNPYVQDFEASLRYSETYFSVVVMP